jgi:hypothetical protein
VRSKKTLFFPFSPGIPWQIKNGKYVIPELPVSLFHSSLKGKDIVVAANGGLVESFYSLSILETLNSMIPSLKLYWHGNKKYLHLIDINGLAKPFDGDLTQHDLDRFPTPIFFDKENRAYFNCLNNYLDVKTYYLTYGYRDCRPLIQQLVEKSTILWDERYLPQFRFFDFPKELDRYLKMHNIHINDPYVLMFPDSGLLSKHDVSCLDWDIHKIRAMAAILSQRSIPLIILTNNSQKYAYSQAKVLPFKLDFATYFIKKASVILSETIDFLLVANAFSDAKLVSVQHKKEFDIQKNNRFLNDRNVIYVRESLSPTEVCGFIAESELL